MLAPITKVHRLMPSMKHLRNTFIVFICALAVFSTATKAQDMSNGANNFYTSDQVTMKKVAFTDLYNMQVVGNLFIPKRYDHSQKLSAIVIGHPMGAVKEQSANLYANKMAEQGFAALAIDLPFWGESGNTARQVVAPDMYSEAFSAAVDYLGTQNFIEREKIGAIGICGSGSFVISAAKIDPRIKAIATVSMYDMGDVTRNGLNESQSLNARKEITTVASNQRWLEFEGAKTKYTGGTVHELTADTHPIQREFYDFYRTSRGQFTPVNSSPDITTHPTLTSNVKFMNFYPLNDIETISPRPMLFISGDKAHSKEFSQKAYERAGEPKELMWIKGAGHVDLYDRVDLIPFDKLNTFFTTSLN